MFRQGTTTTTLVTNGVEEDVQASGNSDTHDTIDRRRGQEDAGSTSQQVLRVQGQPRDQDRVTWSDDVIDNEHMGKKKSKKCCVYHKPRVFGEWSDSEDSSEHHCLCHSED